MKPNTRTCGSIVGALLATTILAGAARGASREENLNDPIVGSEEAVLADAPAVPAPIKRDHATRVVVHLEVKEVEGRLADGVSYTFWTFGGKVPGKFIRVREGDLVVTGTAVSAIKDVAHAVFLHPFFDTDENIRMA